MQIALEMKCERQFAIAISNFFCEKLAFFEKEVNLCGTGLLTGTNVPNFPAEHSTPIFLLNKRTQSSS